MSQSAPRRAHVRAIAHHELETWLSLPGTDTLSDRLLRRRVTTAWDEGGGSPDLTFVAERDGAIIGRLAWLTEPMAASLPDRHEAQLAGLWLPSDEADAVAVGRRLLDHALQALPPRVVAVNGRANPDYMPDWQVRRTLFESAGMPLFQEKEGYRWTPDEPPAARPCVLTFRSIEETGADAFVPVMGRATRGTLDRQDRLYADLVGEEAWGREMLGYLRDEDAPSWLLAFDRDGEGDRAVGYVMLGTFDEPDRGTIVHIGVVPEARGRGYVHELLAELDRHARRRGFAHVVSDADIRNAPMHAALERAGHRSAATPWHVWHYRLER